MLRLNSRITIPESEVEVSFVRAQGPGGQHGDKASTAVHLRFDINASSLPEYYKTRLLRYNDQRITKEGVVVIKAQEFRSQEQNREEALRRLAELIKAATYTPKKRKATRPSKASQQKRIERKKHRGQRKALRKKVEV